MENITAELQTNHITLRWDDGVRYWYSDCGPEALTDEQWARLVGGYIE